MGIVVTIAMLAGLLVLLPSPLSIFRNPPSTYFKAYLFAGILLLLIGLWNAFWYGLQHLDAFWGRAALVSGVIMIAASLLILLSLRKPAESPRKHWFHWLLISGLLLSFLLYLITLVQLNLGMPIIR